MARMHLPVVGDFYGRYESNELREAKVVGVSETGVRIKRCTVSLCGTGAAFSYAEVGWENWPGVVDRAMAVMGTWFKPGVTV